MNNTDTLSPNALENYAASDLLAHTEVILRQAVLVHELREPQSLDIAGVVAPAEDELGVLGLAAAVGRRRHSGTRNVPCFVRRDDHPLDDPVARVRRLFRGMGFEGDELETRTLAFVGFVLFASGTNGPETREEQKRLIESRHAFFTRE